MLEFFQFLITFLFNLFLFLFKWNDLILEWKKLFIFFVEHYLTFVYFFKPCLFLIIMFCFIVKYFFLNLFHSLICSILCTFFRSLNTLTSHIHIEKLHENKIKTFNWFWITSSHMKELFCYFFEFFRREMFRRSKLIPKFFLKKTFKCFTNNFLHRLIRAIIIFDKHLFNLLWKFAERVLFGFLRNSIEGSQASIDDFQVIHRLIKLFINIFCFV